MKKRRILLLTTVASFLLPGLAFNSSLTTNETNLIGLGIPSPFKVTYSADSVNVDLGSGSSQLSNGTLDSNADTFKITNAQYENGNANFASCIDLTSICLEISSKGYALSFDIDFDRISYFDILAGQFANIKLDFLAISVTDLYTNTTSLTLKFIATGVAPKPTPDPYTGFTPAAYFVDPIFPLIDEDKAFNLPFDNQSTFKINETTQNAFVGKGSRTQYSITGGSFDTAFFDNDAFPVITFKTNGIDQFNRLFKLAKGKQLSLETLINKGAFSKEPTLSFLTKKDHKIANLTSKITVNFHGHNGTFAVPDFDTAQHYQYSFDLKNVSIPKKGEKVKILSQKQTFDNFSFDSSISLDFENDLLNTTDLYVKYFPVPKEPSTDTTPGHYEIVTSTGEPLKIIGMTNIANQASYSKQFTNNKKIEMNSEITDFCFPNVAYITIDNNRNKT
ncbi:MAG: hypothetical protein K2L48_03075 [Mycoplasmoidaceae bacterium]|nr:hypothetical protein [Mycoplasmoidaceae bacterium]